MKWVLLAMGWAGALLCSPALMDAALRAAQVFATAVMPSLFPVLVLGALQASGKPSRHACASTLVLGLCSGSPGGARQVAAQWRRGALSPRALRFLLGATGTMSPLFFIGAISAWLGGGVAVGWLMLLCHWAGALLTGAGYALLGGGRPIACVAQATGAENGCEQAGLRALLGGAMDALLLVLGAMMLGACLDALLEQALRLAWPGLPAKAGAALHALLEIGGGAEAVVGAMGTRGIATLCALCSLGGLSLLLQNAGMLEGVASFKTLLCLRLAHAAISGALCRAVLCLWPNLARAAFAGGGGGSAAFPTAALLLALVLARAGLGRKTWA